MAEEKSKDLQRPAVKGLAMSHAQPIETRLNKRGKPSIIGWRGLLYGTKRSTRVMAFVSVVIVAASLTFMQLGFVGIGSPGDYSGYMIMLLAPIALGSLMLGVRSGTLLGFISGAVLFAHAKFQPLDYYEISFVSVFSSFALFAVAGFFIGLFLAIALRKNPPFKRQVIYIAIVSFIVSLTFSISFSLSVFVHIVVQLTEAMIEAGTTVADDAARYYALLVAGQTGSMGLQILLDMAIVFVVCTFGNILIRKIRTAQGAFGLREKFYARMLLVLAMAFLVTASVGFVVITEQVLHTSGKTMHAEAEYLAKQLTAYEKRNENLLQLLLADKQSENALSEDEEKVVQDIISIDNLLEGYSKETNGIVVIFRQGNVLLSDDQDFKRGAKVDDFIGLQDLQSYLKGASEAPDIVQVLYDSRFLTREDYSDLELDVDLTITMKIEYACVEHVGEYSILIMMPATKVFEVRDATMAWVSFSAFVLLLAVFVLVANLLRRIVVRRIDETNEVLEEITDGNLEARVNVRDSREFTSLSDGINATVGALKESIAEAESRMDAELATAKAIQESALPRVFPPFPDIERFDVYATMKAARMVGGDFYDFFLIGESDADVGKLGFVIADVSGKGVPAALFMMKAKTLIRDYVASGIELGEAVENANRQLCDGNDSGMFVTAWIGVLDYATGHIDYVNAGHNPPLVWSFEGDSQEGSDAQGREAGRWHWLMEKSGIPLGLFDGLGYEAFSLECATGDMLLLYTDGVTEAMDVNDELYGESQLEAFVGENYMLHPRAIVEAVRGDVARHAAGAEQSDDITVLALEVGVPPEVTAMLTVRADVKELPHVNGFIHTELDRRLCPLRVQNQLDLAVEELFVNVCHYAYPEEPGSVRVSYTYSADPPSVVVGIADDGVPYNPLEKPDAVTPDDVMEVPIGGLGILMAKRSVDEMTYERVDGSNIITISKKW